MSPLRHILKFSVVIVFGSAGVAAADPLPITDEVKVNSHISGNQTVPKTCAGSSGYVVVWQGPGDGEDIFGQLYTSSGTTIGKEFPINEAPVGDQVQPDVACRADGSFVVVWKGPADQIYARRFLSSGKADSGDILVTFDKLAGEPNEAPAVAYCESGEFLVVWQAMDTPQDSGIFGRIFDSNTTPTNRLQINTISKGDQKDPAVAIVRTQVESFAVVWEGAGSTNIYMQRVRLAEGNLELYGNEIPVNSIASTGLQDPDVAASAISPDQASPDRIVVVWQGPGENFDRIWYRLFYTNDVGVATETVIDEDIILGPQTHPSVSMPDIAPESEVQFIATWSQSGTPFNGWLSSVFIVGARRPRTLLSEFWGAPPANPEFEISELGTSTSNSDVALQPDGSFVVAWQTSLQDTMGEGIYGRFFETYPPDLAIELIDQPPGTYADGSLHHYTIVITNLGPSDASSSLVNDTFPGVLTGVVWTCTATAGSSCISSGSGNLVNSPIRLKAGGSATFRVRGTVPDGATSSFTNTAIVTDLIDTNASNNSDSVTTIWGNPIFSDGFETGTTSNWI